MHPLSETSMEVARLGGEGAQSHTFWRPKKEACHWDIPELAAELFNRKLIKMRDFSVVD